MSSMLWERFGGFARIHGMSDSNPNAPATKSDITRLMKFMIAQDARHDARYEEVLARVSAFRSEMLAAAEGALFGAEKVYRDQTITHDRFDRLEARVASLETRLKKP